MQLHSFSCSRVRASEHRLPIVSSSSLRAPLAFQNTTPICQWCQTFGTTFGIPLTRLGCTIIGRWASPSGAPRVGSTMCQWYAVGGTTSLADLGCFLQSMVCHQYHCVQLAGEQAGDRCILAPASPPVLPMVRRKLGCISLSSVGAASSVFSTVNDI